MTTLTDHPLEGIVAAFQRGDLAAATALMSPTIRWHSPGAKQPAAGTHEGVDAVLGAFATIAAQPGSLELDVLDVLHGNELLGVVYEHRRVRDDATLKALICLVASAQDGVLTEVWEHIYDLFAFDDFYGGTS
jgi:ketosteroid isomerase-like protein